MMGTLQENVEKHVIHSFFLFKKFSMPHFYLLPLLPIIMSSLAFTKMFEFLPFPAIINSVIIPSFDNLTKHHTWYLLNADLFISIHGILYGIHQQQVEDSLLFQEVLRFGQDHQIGTVPFHPIPFNNLKNDVRLRNVKDKRSTVYTLVFVAKIFARNAEEETLYIE
jgi:hypothetical protein